MAVRGLTKTFTALALGLWLCLWGPQGTEAADPALGKQKAKACQTCHGIDGLARIPNAPHIAGESRVYIVTQLKAFRSGARTHEIMSLIAKDLSDESLIAKDLSDEDIENLAAWYSSIEIEVRMPE
jgi:cytochrome c553